MTRDPERSHVMCLTVRLNRCFCLGGSEGGLALPSCWHQPDVTAHGLGTRRDNVIGWLKESGARSADQSTE